MWLARIWFLLALCALAVALGGALTLPGARDERVTALRDQVAAVEAAAVQAEVAAEVADVRRATQLAAQDPDLLKALAAQTPDLPAHVGRALIEHELGRLNEKNPRLDLLVVAPDGAVRGATRAIAAEAGGLARTPQVKGAQAGNLQVGLLRGEAARAVVAVPIPGEGVGVLAAFTRPPTATAVAAHGALGTDTRIVTLIDGQPAEASLGDEAGPQAARAAAAEGAAPVALTLDGVPSRARRYALPASPGVAFVLAWPAEAPATFAETGGFAGLFRRALQRPSETAVFVGGAVILWLLGVLVADAGRRKAIRRAAAEVAGSGELAPIDPASAPGWLRPLLQAAADAADDARRRAPRYEPPASESGEISAERVVETLEPSAPPAHAPAPRREPSDPPEHFLASPPAPEPPRAPTPAPAPESSDTFEPEVVPGEGTTELPARRGGASLRDRLTFDSDPVARLDDDDEDEASADEIPTREVGPRPGLSLFDRLLPAAGPRPDEDLFDDDALLTADRPSDRLSTPPPALEDEPDSSVFDLSLSGSPATPDRWPSEPPAPAEESADGSMRLPGRPGGLLAQLRQKKALDPEEGLAGESTVVRPIPLSLLDASADRDPDRTAVGPPPGRDAERDTVERLYEQVFEEFLAVKRACGESTHAVDYARFRAKLVRTRKSLIERFQCADVRFRVYVKDGKAALKAAPRLEGEDGEETLG